jgi:hypothetical protein
MAAAAILLIEAIDVKWAITIRFQLNLIHRLRKTFSVQNQKTGNNRLLSRWPPPPCWKFKCMLKNGQLPPDIGEN